MGGLFGISAIVLSTGLLVILIVGLFRKASKAIGFWTINILLAFSLYVFGYITCLINDLQGGFTQLLKGGVPLLTFATTFGSTHFVRYLLRDAPPSAKPAVALNAVFLLGLIMLLLLTSTVYANAVPALLAVPPPLQKLQNTFNWSVLSALSALVYSLAITVGMAKTRRSKVSSGQEGDELQ